jgi:hypothetical protein
MKKILIASCIALNCLLPQQGFSADLKWSEVISIQGAGATNCGKERITNEAWDKCEAWVKDHPGAVVKDVELYNIATETDKGTSWDPKLKCSFRANIKCGYAVESGLKLNRTGRLKPAAAPAAGCAEPPPGENGELVIGKCEENPPAKKAAAVKKTAAASAPPQVKKTAAAALPTGPAAIQRSNLLGVKGSNLPSCGIDEISSEIWRKCDIWAAKKKRQGGSPVVQNVELHKFTMTTQGQAGCSYEATLKCLYTDSKAAAKAAAPAAARKAVKKSVPQNKAETQEFVDSSGMRWSPLLAIEGTGVTNCGQNRISNEAWEKCEEWTAQKKPSGQLRPTLKDVELYNIASENHQGPSWAPKQSCSFHATLKCGYKME